MTLLGQTVNAYGHDLPAGANLADLLRAVDAIPGLDRLRFLTSHPKYMSDEIDRRHGRTAVRSASTSTCRCRRATTKSCGGCGGPTPPISGATGSPTPAKRCRMYGRDRHHRRLPRRDRRAVPEHATTCSRKSAVTKSMSRCIRPGRARFRRAGRTTFPHEEKHRRHQAVETAAGARSLPKRNHDRVGEVYEVLIDTRQKGRWSGRTRGNVLVHSIPIVT